MIDVKMCRYPTPPALLCDGRLIGPLWRFCLLVALASGWAGATRSAFAADAPKVEVTSRVPNEGTVHVIGFLEGTNLKTAGIFDHGEKLKDIDVAGTPGSQRVNFNFAIEAPSPTMTIEVTDMMGRSASAQVMPASAGAPAAEPGSSVASGESSEPTEGVAPSRPASESGNAVEIPRYGGNAAFSRRPNPRFAGGVGNPMSNVEINVMSVLPLLSKPGNYEVTGQIVGVGVRRAGIYVAGRPVKPIPVSVGRFSPFDVVFPLTGGRDATIRAYGAGREYVELPIDVNEPTTTYNSPYGGSRSLVNPYGPNP